MKHRSMLLTLLVFAATLVLNACGAPMDAAKSRSDALIHAGEIPPAQELRVSEYLNYYKQDFPAPVNSAVGLDTQLGNSRVSTDGGDVWLQIGLRARDADSQAIAPLNLALVIDRSGSMNTPDKMPLLKKSLGVFLHSLAPNDLIAIVTYSDRAEMLVPSRQVGDGTWIEDAVNRIEPNGGTNLNDGLALGLQQVSNNFDARRNNRVILLTDGIANVGVTDASQIAAMAKQYNDRGIYLATIGLGHEYNDALLSQLAQQGKGGYHFVGSAADMDKIFHEEVSGLLQKAVERVSVTLVPDAGVSVLQITGYDGTPPAGNLTIKLQDMGTGDTQIVLAHLHLAPGSSGVRTLANVKLQYTDVLEPQSESIERTVTAESMPSANVDPLTNVQVLRNVTIQRTAEGLKEIDRLYHVQQYQVAWALAYQLEQDLRHVAQLTGDAQLNKDADTMHQYQDTLAQWVERQTGARPNDVSPTEPTYSNVQRLPTFTPVSTEIEVR